VRHRSISRVLVTDHVFKDLNVERAVLEPLGAELVEAPGVGEEDLIGAVEGADALLVCFAQVTAPVIRAAAESGVKVIARYGVGYDNIDIEVATECGIPVTYVPDYCLDEVADHTFALLLALARDVVCAAQSVERGGWAVPHGDVHRIRGQRLAVIGAGGIGRRVIERAQPFGLAVVGFDPYLEHWDVPARRAPSFADAVREADMISLHAPLTAENHHLINAGAIAAMERAPIIVNTARGALVDLEAAVAALDAGALSGIALDVAESEPPPSDHPLRSHARAILTPHMAFYSVEALAELQRRAAEEVARVLAGAPPDRPVNSEVVSTRK
jgi:D-3-phosphoglycerate dehydrogenase